MALSKPFNQSEEYRKISAGSYAGDTKVGWEISGKRLNALCVLDFFGAQPFGICGRVVDGVEEVLIASYFYPAICRIKVIRDETGLHFHPSWIRGVNVYGDEGVRMFPDVLQVSGVNRMQTVSYDHKGNIWYSRNGDRDFFVVSPPSQEGGKWSLVYRVRLPVENCSGLVESALLMGSSLVTIEITSTKWRKVFYHVDGYQVEYEAHMSIPLWRHGFGKHPSPLQETLYTVTDERAPGNTHGIYFGDDLVVPRVTGSGIYFLQDGSALVSRYSEINPGAIVYVPAGYFLRE